MRTDRADEDEDEDDADQSLREWLHTSRYITVKQLREARSDEPAVTPAFPKRRLTQDQKDAIISAVLILLLVAGSAFLAGLL